MDRYRGLKLDFQGTNFLVVMVRPALLKNKERARQWIEHFREHEFRTGPVILMAQPELDGIPVYYGRTDITNHLSSLPVLTYHWQEYPFKVSPR